jgi:hypothetical protein
MLCIGTLISAERHVYVHLHSRDFQNGVPICVHVGVSVYVRVMRIFERIRQMKGEKRIERDTYSPTNVVIWKTDQE